MFSSYYDIIGYPLLVTDVHLETPTNQL